jgi:hypothetical protein
MMIAFQDFVPRVTNRRMMGLVSDYEMLCEVVSRANIWIEKQQVDVINVETVQVTNMETDPEVYSKGQIPSPNNGSPIYQVVRVWYREKTKQDAAYTGQTTRLS